ncbi:MAG TPA: carbon-nitrogen hydrolase family protein, partial [Verrucomicrobiae bacterium]|nr:carbon-nitrogen hydrolase family protein [Verrucomicrobiae bacterium]
TRLRWVWEVKTAILGPPMKPAKLHVAAAQMKFRPTIRENVERIIELIHSSARDGVDAILFPECAVTGYRREFKGLEPGSVHRACAEVARAAREMRCNVLVGAPTFRNGRWFNSLLVFGRRGGRTFEYSKIHLTDRDARFFTSGNSLAFFRLEAAPATAIICHERRYPELVRLPVMMGAQVVFHPNAGLDSLEVSKTKRRGRDGVAVRAFENQVYYVFANTVGPQGDGLWSAGDSKIVAPDSRVLALANNRDEMVVQAELDLTKAGRKYAREAQDQPVFLRNAWKQMLALCKGQLRKQGVK